MSSPSIARGVLTVLVNDVATQVATGVREAMIVDGGRHLVFTTTSGKGFEAEGENLYVFNPRTGKIGLLASEVFYFELSATQSVRVKGVPTLVASMRDGGLGASHVAIINMRRGEVFRAPLSTASVVQGGKVTIDTFPAEHWEGLPTQPKKSEVIDLAVVNKAPLVEVPGNGVSTADEDLPPAQP
jgi:hypothetical protein